MTKKETFLKENALPFEIIKNNSSKVSADTQVISAKKNSSF
jgi:hypothetical protein